MLSLLVGGLFIVMGLMGIYQWPQEMIAFFKGFVPVSLVLGGCVAALIGVLKVLSKREDLLAKFSGQEEPSSADGKNHSDK